MDVISVLVLLLVCVFTAADDSLNITCEDVTGHVGVQLNLTCRVSYKDNTNCMKMYKLTNKDKGTEICREEFTSDSCIQRIFFSCPYTVNEVMRTTTTFKFFIQTKQGEKSAEFTVSTSGARKDEPTPAKKEYTSGKTDNTVLVVTGLVICLVIVVALGLTLRKYNCTNNLKRGYDLGKHEENNISEPENTEVV